MSKNILFYFSGTGNSLSVARKLAEILGETAIISMLSNNLDMEIASNIETIGLVYPVYMNATPRVVKDFISGLKLKHDCYIYAIATHGGIPGKAGCHLHRVLKDNSLELNGYFEIEMINNTPKGVAPKFLMHLEWEKEISCEKVEAIIQQNNHDIHDIATAVQSRDDRSIEELLSKPKGLNYWMMKQIWKLSEKSKPKLNFLLDEGCTGCGICEKVCTTNRIHMLNGRPNWEENECNYCYACFNFCPTQAIGVKYYIKKLGRYHHPDIDWKDIANECKSEK